MAMYCGLSTRLSMLGAHLCDTGIPVPGTEQVPREHRPFQAPSPAVPESPHPTVQPSPLLGRKKKNIFFAVLGISVSFLILCPHLINIKIIHPSFMLLEISKLIRIV